MIICRLRVDYLTRNTSSVLVEPDSRICEPLVMMYWSPELKILCSTNMASTSFSAVSWSVLVAKISGRTPRYIAIRRWAEMLGVSAKIGKVMLWRLTSKAVEPLSVRATMALA